MPVAIVTGASRGFGRAVATDLAKDGWKLVIDGRRPGALGQTEESLAALGGAVRAVVGDVTDPDHRPRWLPRPSSSGVWTSWSTTPANWVPVRCRTSIGFRSMS